MEVGPRLALPCPLEAALGLPPLASIIGATEREDDNAFGLWDDMSHERAPRRSGTSAEVFNVRITNLPNHLLSKTMLEAILEQADVDKHVLKFNTVPGEELGEAVIALTNADAAERCAAHFNGQRWDASDTLVEAEALLARSGNTAICDHCQMEYDLSDSIQFSCGHSYHRTCPAVPLVAHENPVREGPCHRCWRVCGRALKKTQCNIKDDRCKMNHDIAAMRYCQFESPMKPKLRLHPSLYRKLKRMIAPVRPEFVFNSELPESFPPEFFASNGPGTCQLYRLSC